MQPASVEPYAPLLASLTLGSLGIVALASGRRETVWRLFALFCWLLAGATGMAFAALRAPSDSVALVYARLAPGLAFLSFVFAVLYVAEFNELRWSTRVFGREILFDFSATERRVVLFGRTTSLRVYLPVMIAVWVLGVIAVALSDLLVRSVHVLDTGRVAIEHGPFVYVGLVFVLTGLTKIDYFLVRAYRDATTRYRREYLLLNFLAFNVAYVPALAAALLLPLAGFALHPLLFLGFPVAVLLFYVAILRYQFSQVDALTRGLEQRVEERTAALRQAQVRLVQAEKMASLGRLVAGVAHELNNPVGAIRSMQQSAETTMQRLDTAVDALPPEVAEKGQLSKLVTVLRRANRVVGDGSARVAEVVARLRSFARLDEADLQHVDVRAGIRDVLALFEGEFGSEVNVVVELGDMPAIRCFPGALNQVWMNLLVNAKDALGGRPGTVRVSADCNADTVRVCVTDSGCGIPPADLPRVFDPGFTTKGVGVGTGLGLAICYQIVEEHGGRIHVASPPGEGTTVTVDLPRPNRGIERRN
jgi:signal transduction histidine kinase